MNRYRRRWQDKVIRAMNIIVCLGLLIAGAVGLAVYFKYLSN